ncbi:MAG: rhomboid family intramembrane serine protease [Saprospiraceae bacterium]|nr:rhomboid family intramembrane serine protease [Saprospiraceae bacterium]
MLRLTDVVKQLLIINGILFLISRLPLYQYFPDLALYYPGSVSFRPYQIVTHMFMHGNLSHLFFNMFMLATFGPMLEALWGSKRFLFFYLFCGVGAILVHLLFWYIEISGLDAFQYSMYLQQSGSVVGASGALFGILVAYGMYFPNQQLMLLFPPIPMKAIYLVIFAIVLELVMVAQGAQTQIAHFAHLGGALFGFLIIVYWRKFRK